MVIDTFAPPQCTGRIDDSDRLALSRQRNRDYLQGFYFLIDSDNCNSQARHHLYGYTFYHGVLYVNCDLPREIESLPLDSVGVFCTVQNLPDKLLIRQDVMGSYGLYYYQAEDGYFAISNSFIYLLRHLCCKRSLMLNDDYARHYLQFGLCALSVTETLVQEIHCVQMEEYVEINKKCPHIVLKQNFDVSRLYQVPLATRQGINILDQWQSRWQSIYGALIKGGQRLQIDVSGGFDSRIGLALLLSSSVDVDKVKFRTDVGNVYTQKEDFEIASAMAEGLGFSLNRIPWHHTDSVPISGDFAFESSAMVKMGFHKQYHMAGCYWQQPFFLSTGLGGENLRDHWGGAKDEFIGRACQGQRYHTLDTSFGVRAILERDYLAVRKYYGDMDDFERIPFNYVYRAARNKNHSCKEMVENMVVNAYNLTPLMDFNLYQLKVLHDDNIDWNLLFAVILDRYCPKLLEYRYEGGRSIVPETVQKAKTINAQFPNLSMPRELLPLKIINDNQPDLEALRFEAEHVNCKGRESLLGFYRQPINKAYFCQRYGVEPYLEAEHNLERLDFASEEQAITVATIGMVLRWLDGGQYGSSWPNFLKPINGTNYYSDESRFMDLNKSKKIREILGILLAARVDFKNYGQESNRVEIVSTDSRQLFTLSQAPRWFTDAHGAGCVLTGERDAVSLKLTCRGDGELVIECKGVDKMDHRRERPRIWVTYSSLRIDGEEMLAHPEDAWHDEPYRCKLAVHDGQTLNIEIEWRPYPYMTEDIIKLVQQLCE